MWSGAKITPDSHGFAGNRTAMLKAVDELRALEARAEAKSEERRARLPFLRLHSMTGYLGDAGEPEKTVPGSTFVGGIADHGTGANGPAIALDVAEGNMVEPGQRPTVLEEMKMQHKLVAEVAGRVVAVHVMHVARVTGGHVIAVHRKDST